jgi:hypothetical protein
VYFLHKYEYGTLKSVDIILGRGKGRGRKMKGMKQSMVRCTHTWKSFSGTGLFQLTRWSQFHPCSSKWHNFILLTDICLLGSWFKERKTTEAWHLWTTRNVNIEWIFDGETSLCGVYANEIVATFIKFYFRKIHIKINYMCIHKTIVRWHANLI